MAEPLRKETGGVGYARPPEVERQIDELSAITGEERIRRFSILDNKDPDFVRSECLLYFLRRFRGSSPLIYEKIWKILVLRLKQVLPGGWRRENGPLVAAEERAASTTLGKFMEMLAQDYNGYDERLDFFEVRFAAAVAALRRTALSKEYKEGGREIALPDDTDAIDKIQTSEPGFNPFNSGKYSDPIYRIRLRTAIDALPDDQRQVLILDWVGMPFTTNAPTVATIGSIVGCGEQAARQKRDRAYKAVRIALEGDDE
ncbi:hypothetical protein K32_44530 [Kaistia sp. 32K]|uniref:hypothetical protein n=1 Tax=Kaistia sp. 32K TaxID=2795690 RepID=UPI00191631A7|nr:hypothetical protein [Kaistia sp. 32K]BCP55836.1 hypothetical protein K32_44530 [Kaistia sp. 32K]